MAVIYVAESLALALRELDADVTREWGNGCDKNRGENVNEGNGLQITHFLTDRPSKRNETSK